MSEFKLLQIAVGKRKTLTSDSTPREWARLLQSAEEQGNVGVMSSGVEKLQKKTFAVALMYVIEQLFGETDKLLCLPDEKVERQSLTDILTGDDVVSVARNKVSIQYSALVSKNNSV